MRFAFIFINAELQDVERTSVRNGDSVFIGVRDVGEACTEAASLVNGGIGCIELCGAFGRQGQGRSSRLRAGGSPWAT